MEYVLTFLEGVMSFISPCVLPLLPVYISYFAGREEKKIVKTVLNSIGFVIGFSIVFILLAVFASTLGAFISSNLRTFKIAFGVINIVLGLNYIGIINIKFLNNTRGIENVPERINFLKAILFGVIFSITWTPCVGTFLSSALMLVINSQDLIKGVILMGLYSAGLGIPLILSAVLIDSLKNGFSFVKKHYRVVKIISGLVLIGMGIFIMVR
jgi:cytochrome c-type biogenesis protein